MLPVSSQGLRQIGRYPIDIAQLSQTYAGFPIYRPTRAHTKRVEMMESTVSRRAFNWKVCVGLRQAPCWGGPGPSPVAAVAGDAEPRSVGV